ncbi:MAG: SWIM zinc finger family protein [Candidatus Thiodiazotropha sp.]
MEFTYRYASASRVSNDSERSRIAFEPDTLRPPTYFKAELGQTLLFREAISALHDVVVSDLRTKPKDRQAYFEWLAAHESALLAEFMAQKQSTEKRLGEVRLELNRINAQYQKAMGPFLKARQKYFNYLYATDYDAWFVLDPVISVHPDELFFECFSNDESTYARLSCGYEVFHNIGEKAYGTTNIDYSDSLYNEFQKLRDYKRSQFHIDPDGFEIATAHEETYLEEKIDLPDSWVRGFLQVSAAMGMPMTKFRLHPMDVYNLCLFLRRHKERQGPRSIRFQLTPGQPVRLLFEPWNHLLECKRSPFSGNQETEIRMWGRRRLLTLERLIPLASHFTVRMLGTGLPAFFIAHMGNMSFTLGLSGWTANDWSRMGNFDLMAPRAEVDELTQRRVFDALKETWHESSDSLSARLQLDKATIESSLGLYTQAGRVIYDLAKGVYRLRELSREPLPMKRLRYDNEREAQADNFIRADLVTLGEVTSRDGHLRISGEVLDNAVRYQPMIVLDRDQHLVEGRCNCHFYVHNKLYKGPCEHMLAIRRQHAALQDTASPTIRAPAGA